MAARSPLRSLSHAFRYGVLTALAVVGLFASLVPAASAQDDLAGLYASQLFKAITDESVMFLGTPHAMTHTPEGTFTGYAGPAQFGDVLADSFSNLDFRIQSIAQASGDWVIASFALTGINTGEYKGLDADCAAISVPGVALLHFEEFLVQVENPDSAALGQYLDPVMETRSRVVEQWIEYDTDLIESQITAFNVVDAGVRPGCSAQLAVE